MLQYADLLVHNKSETSIRSIDNRAIAARHVCVESACGFLSEARIRNAVNEDFRTLHDPDFAPK